MAVPVGLGAGVALAAGGGLLIGGAMVALALALAVLLRLDVALAALVALVFTRAPDIAEEFHGVPSPLVPFVIVLLVLARPWVRPDHPNDVVVGRAALLFGVYGVVLLASTLVADEPDRSLEAVLVYGKAAAVGLCVVVLLRTPQALRLTLWTLLAAGSAIGALAVLQFVTGSTSNYYGFAQSDVQQIVGATRDLRAGGQVGDPNMFAQLMVVLVPIGIERARHEQRGFLRLAALVAAGLSGVTVLLTFSRGGLVALVFVTVLSVWDLPSRRRLLTAFALAVMLAALVAPRSYLHRLGESLDVVPGIGSGRPDDPAVAGRSSEMLSALLMFEEHPVLGVGAANYPAKYQDYSQGLGLDPRREERSPHSLPLEVAAETGVVGLAAFGALLTLAFRSMAAARRAFRDTGAVGDESLVRGFQIGVVGYLVCSPLLHVAYPRPMWMLLGLAMATIRAAPTVTESRPREEAVRA